MKSTKHGALGSRGDSQHLAIRSGHLSRPILGLFSPRSKAAESQVLSLSAKVDLRSKNTCSLK